MEIFYQKFAKYVIVANIFLAVIIVTPIIERRSQFLISSTVGHLLLQTGSLLLTPFKPNDQVYFMNAPELIKKNGYQAEVHHVNNSQFYRLELHRVLVGKDVKLKEKRNPVLLHHGIFCSSADFVVNQPHEGLAYQLADKGYDVWIANVRGNTYSRYNYKISHQDPKFWEFGLDEVIEQDLPVLVDYILKTSDQSQIYYIGHSMGATVALGFLSSQPEYNQKVKALFALGPGVFLSDSKGIVPMYIRRFTTEFYEDNESMPREIGMGYITAALMNTPLSFLGNKFVEHSTGDKGGSVNETLLALYLNQLPAGIPTRILRHFGQMFKNGKFTKYDWGKEKNELVYKQDTPPSYDLSKLTTSTHVFYAPNDILTPPSGSRQLASLLPNCKGLHQVGTENSGHMYLLWGTDTSFHRKIMDLMESY